MQSLLNANAPIFLPSSPSISPTVIMPSPFTYNHPPFKVYVSQHVSPHNTLVRTTYYVIDYPYSQILYHHATHYPLPTNTLPYISLKKSNAMLMESNDSVEGFEKKPCFGGQKKQFFKEKLMWKKTMFQNDVGVRRRSIKTRFYGNLDGLSSDKICQQKKTTLMIRNIPNHLLMDDLIKTLDEHCLEENKKAKSQDNPILSEYDCLYLVMDFRTGANRGYGFVNFTSVTAASRFFVAFDKFKWPVSRHKKICKIAFAKFQGKEDLIKQYKMMEFRCDTESYLPAVFDPPRGGDSVHSKRINVGKLLRNRQS